MESLNHLSSETASSTTESLGKTLENEAATSQSDTCSLKDLKESGNLENMLEKKNKKKYSVITQQVREKFLEKVLSREATIKDVSIVLSSAYSNLFFKK